MSYHSFSICRVYNPLHLTEKIVESAYDFTELKTLIEINSHTKNKDGVDKVHALFSKWMIELGFTADVHKRTEIGDHLHYRSAKGDGKKLLLLGHQDTVFPLNTFEGFSQDEEWVYGPGVCDMKGGNIIILNALRRLKQQQGHISNIDVLMVSDEETGSDDSKLLTAKIAKDYDACLVFEAAGKDHEVVIARKGIATFQVNITGKAAHAGNHYADGINANLAAARLLVELTRLTNLNKGTTVNVGKMKGGIGANTISPSAELKVEARFTHCEERDRVLSSIELLCNTSFVDGTSVQTSGGLQRDVMQPTESQSSFLQLIEEILGQPLKTEKRGGVSDANVVSASGVPTLDGFGPFGDGDHTIHERALKSSFVRRTDEVSKILLALKSQ